MSYEVIYENNENVGKTSFNATTFAGVMLYTYIHACKNM